MATQQQNALVILRLPEVIARTGLSRSTIYGMMQNQSVNGQLQFPKSIKLTARSVGWIEAEVNDFIQARINESRSLIIGE